MSKITKYQAFVAIVEQASLNKAAASLNLSPSAVSKQLRSLESDLGVTLIDRSNRTLNITEPGRTFYRHCQKILRDIVIAEEAAFNDSINVNGKIKVTFSSALVHSPLMPLFAVFSNQHPNIKFDFQISDSVKDLVATDIDFSFRMGKLADNRLRAVELADLNLIFCASPNYIRRLGEPKSIEELKNHHLTLPSTVSISRLLKQLSMNQGETSRDISFNTSNDDNATLACVKEGMCIAPMIDYCAKSEIEKGNLVQVLKGEYFYFSKLYLVYAKQGKPPKKLRLFINFIKSHYQTTQEQLTT